MKILCFENIHISVYNINNNKINDKSLDSKMVSAFRGRDLLITFVKIFVCVDFLLSLESVAYSPNNVR
jgi:hypothetical protein